MSNANANTAAWEDVTQQLRDAAAALPIGGMLTTPDFRMAEAANAIELMDKQLDFAANRKAILSAASRLEDGSLPLLGLSFEDVIDVMDTLLQLEMSWLDGNSAPQTVMTCLYTHPAALQTMRMLTGRQPYTPAAPPRYLSGMSGAALEALSPEALEGPPAAAVLLKPLPPAGSRQWTLLSALLAYVTGTLKSMALTHKAVLLADIYEEEDFQAGHTGACDFAWAVGTDEVASLLHDAELAVLATVPEALRSPESVRALSAKPHGRPGEGGGGEEEEVQAAGPKGKGKKNAKNSKQQHKPAAAAAAGEAGARPADSSVLDPLSPLLDFSLGAKQQARQQAAPSTSPQLAEQLHAGCGGTTEDASPPQLRVAAANALLARLRFRRAYLASQVCLSWSRRTPAVSPFGWGGTWDLGAASAALEVAWQLVGEAAASSRLARLEAGKVAPTPQLQGKDSGAAAPSAAAPPGAATTPPSPAVPGVFPGYEKALLRHGTPRFVPLPSHGAAFVMLQRHIANAHLLCSLPEIASHDPLRRYAPSDLVTRGHGAAGDDEEEEAEEVRYAQRVASSPSAFVRCMSSAVAHAFGPSGRATVPLSALTSVAAKLRHEPPSTAASVKDAQGVPCSPLSPDEALFAVPDSGIRDPPMQWFTRNSPGGGQTLSAGTGAATPASSHRPVGATPAPRRHVSLNGLANFLEDFSLRAPDIGVRSLAFSLLTETPTVAQSAEVRRVDREAAAAAAATTATSPGSGTPPAAAPDNAPFPPEDPYGDFHLADALSPVVLGTHGMCELVRGSMLSAGVHPEALASAGGRRLVFILAFEFHLMLRVLCGSRLRMRRRMNTLLSDWGVVMDECESVDGALGANTAEAWASALRSGSPEADPALVGMRACHALCRCLYWAMQWSTRLQVLHTRIGAECELFHSDEGCSLYWQLDFYLNHHARMTRQVHIARGVLAGMPEARRMRGSTLAVLEAGGALQLLGAPPLLPGGAGGEPGASADEAEGGAAREETALAAVAAAGGKQGAPPSRKAGGGSRKKNSQRAAAEAEASLLAAEAAADRSVRSLVDAACLVSYRDADYLAAQQSVCRALFRLLVACRLLRVWTGLDVDSGDVLEEGDPGEGGVVPSITDTATAAAAAAAAPAAITDVPAAAPESPAPAATAPAPPSPTAAPAAASTLPPSPGPPTSFRRSRAIFESRWRDFAPLLIPRQLTWDDYVDAFLRMPLARGTALRILQDAHQLLTVSATAQAGAVHLACRAACAGDAVLLGLRPQPAVAPPPAIADASLLVRRHQAPSSAAFLSAGTQLLAATRLQKIIIANRAFLSRLAGQPAYLDGLPLDVASRNVTAAALAASVPAQEFQVQLSRTHDPVFAALRLQGLL